MSGATHSASARVPSPLLTRLVCELATGEDWRNWLAARLGTRDWTVGPRLTPRMRQAGADLAISQKQFQALMFEYGIACLRAELAAYDKGL